ncbi:MAG: GFA family protein [Dongiaceae bacterium]
MVTLEGSCACGKVSFTIKSHTPDPYMRCYCSICRKTDGGGGYAINVMGDADTLKLRGKKHVAVWRATIDGKRSEARRHFCKHCGSALYVSDPRWPALMHPHASAIDKGLRKPKSVVHILLDSKADWVTPQQGGKRFRHYPDLSIEDWHKKNKRWSA